MNREDKSGNDNPCVSSPLRKGKGKRLISLFAKTGKLRRNMRLGTIEIEF